MSDVLAGRLRTVHDRLADEPLPERLEEGSCEPNASLCRNWRYTPRRLAQHPSSGGRGRVRMYPRHPRSCSSKLKSACAAADCGPGTSEPRDTRGRR
jgi:hypothetical protein